jgi:hypothetical protein
MACSEKGVLRPKHPEAAGLCALAFTFENPLTTGACFTVIGLSEHLIFGHCLTLAGAMRLTVVQHSGTARKVLCPLRPPELLNSWILRMERTMHLPPASILRCMRAWLNSCPEANRGLLLPNTASTRPRLDV